MSRIGTGALVGGMCGNFLVTLAYSLLGSNLAFLSGLIFGVPTGIILGTFAAAMRAKKSEKTDLIVWILISTVMILILATIAAIAFINWKYGPAN
jgi:hypothetical protein